MRSVVSIFSIALFCVACGGPDAAPEAGSPEGPMTPPEGAQAPEAAAMTLPELPAGTSVSVDGSNSTFEFVGAKITNDHQGGFKGYEGHVVLDEGGQVVGTTFTVSLGTVFTDSEKLTAHLQKPDFFDVEQFGSARFSSADIQSAGEGYTVSGVLDLHGVTKTLSFPAKIDVADESVHVTAEFDLNRQDFGISYPGKPDDLIKDNVKIKLDLAFPRG
jgi:polyisoprenoid-binding protein YceI